MKILYVTTIGTTMGFFKSFIGELVKEGHIVDIATNETTSKVPDYYRELGCEIYHISTSRSPLNKGNIDAIKQIKQLVSKNQYNIVHCHTPVAAMCTRLACKDLRNNGVRVIYTTHGFHFYEGAPKKNWFVYYPIEKLCSQYTDTIVTINKEDYVLAKKKMHAKEIVYVPGVGIDVDKFSNINVDRSVKRKELGVPDNAMLILSVGELNKNKNHETIIRAIANMDNVYYIIAGKGDLEDHLKNIINDLGIGNRVILLGYRTDIPELCISSDIFAFPSFREGLGLAAIEAMYCGLPLVTSNIHGINDYSEEGVTGCKCDPGDIEAFSKSIDILANNPDLRKIYGENNKKIALKYDVKNIIPLMKKVYNI